MKTIKIDIYDLATLWQNANEAQRLEMIKSIILTAQNPQGFLIKVRKAVNSPKFEVVID